MIKLRLQTIDYKSTKDFFTTFVSENEVHQFSYQLTRMFDFSQAKEGDYFTVYITDEDNIEKPFFSLQLSATNSRRIIDFKDNILFNKSIEKEVYTENLEEGISLILSKVKEDEEIEFSGKRVEILLDTKLEYFEIFKSVIEKFNFEKRDEISKYRKKIDLITSDDESNINITTLKDILKDKVGLLESSQFQKLKGVKFIEMEIDDRYELIDENDSIMKNFDIDESKLYIDFMEQGTKCEIYWEAVYLGDELLGYFMPSSTRGTFKDTEIFNYFVNRSNNDNLYYKYMLSKLFAIAVDEGSNRVLVSVFKEDAEFVKILVEFGFEVLEDTIVYR